MSIGLSFHRSSPLQKFFPLAACTFLMTTTVKLSASEAADSDLEEVVVTGTQIRGVAPVGSPLIEVDRSAIVASGATTTDEIMRLQPQVFNFGIADTQRNGTGGAGNITYGSAINLRGLSPFATLTLVDGHRVNPSGTVGAAVDPSTIPAVMLDRVDIVADGASATYGSDAIAGVVNLLLRRNFEGVDASARGDWADGYNKHQFDLLAGHRWASGQLTIGAEMTRSSALNGTDRDYYTSDLTAFGGSDNRVTTCSPGTITYNGVDYAIPAKGVTAATASQLVSNTRNLCDPLKYQDLIPEQRRTNVALTFNQEINDRMSLFATAYYSMRKYEREVPLASGPLTVTSANPYYVAVPGNTANDPEVVNYWFGNQGIGNTWRDHGSSKNYNAIAGLDVKLSDDWRLEVSGAVGHDHDVDSEVNISMSAPNVAAALTSSDPATALNPFGQTSTAVLEALKNNVFIAPGTTDQYDIQTKVDGPLFSLPGGQVRVAIGAQYEHNKLEDGLILGTTQSSAPAFGGLQELSRSWRSYFGEVLVPIVGDSNEIAGIKSLDFDFGIRYTDYTVVGSTTDPKLGLNWSVNDALKFHASYGTSFRAPGLSELVGPVTAVFFQNYASPNGPVPGYALGGGNIALKPEKATTWSLGGEWEPTASTTLSLNYFHINYEDQISSYLSNLNLLQNPSQYSSLITLCPSAECTALLDRYVFGTGPGATPEPVFGPKLGSPPIGVFVDGTEQNLATTRTSGIDFQLSQLVPGTGIGDLRFGVSGTYFLQFDETLTPGAPVSNNLGTIGFPQRLRLRAHAGWDKGALGAMLFVNYQSSYHNNLATPEHDIAAYTTVDVHFQVDLDRLLSQGWTKGTRVNFDVRNLFDKDPPFANLIPSSNGGGGFDPQAASPIGRMIGVYFGKSFGADRSALR
jgi:iron complex outermembrane receptor protein